MITALQPAQIKCSVCGESFMHSDPPVARYFGWQHTKKRGWRCPEHAPKRSKFKNVKTELDGVTFHSQAEAVRYSALKLLEAAGYIRNLELQPHIELQAGFRRNGKWIAAIVYIGDFRYLDCETGELVVEDVKGAKTAVYSLKKRLLLYKFPKLDFREIKV